MKRLLFGAVIYIFTSISMFGQIQLSENFDSGNTIPTSSSSAPASPTDYTTSSGIWTLFKTYRHGTSNYSAPYALRLLKNTIDAPSYAVTPGLNSAGTLSFFAYGSASKPIYVYKSINNGTSWTFVDSVMTGAGVFVLCSIQINDASPSIKLKIVNGTGAGNDLNFDNVEITGYTSAASIQVSVSSLPSFGGIAAGSASSSQSYVISASNFSGDLNIAAPAYYSISSNDTIYYDSLKLQSSQGAVPPTTIYARFDPDSAIGNVTGEIVHSGGSAAAKSVAVSGIALASEPTQQCTVTFGYQTGSIIRVKFNGGNGTRRIVVARKLVAPSWTPSDGAAVSGVNKDFTLAADQGGGNKIVYDGTGNMVDVIRLEGTTLYHFAAYEYNVGSANSQNYNTVNPGRNSISTIITPTINVFPQSFSFGNTVVNTTSAAQSYIMSLIYIVPSNGTAVIKAPDGFELSRTYTGAYSDSLLIPFTGGYISSVEIFVRFKPSVVKYYSGNITHVAGYTSISLPVVSGNGITSAEANVFQAEDGLYDGSYARRQFSGYTGSGYVDISDKTGGSLEFLFRKSSASTDTIAIYYANGGSARNFSVKLNNSAPVNLNFPSTGSWSTWSSINYVAALTPGINRISFASTTNATNANIDKIKLSGELATPVYKLQVLKSGKGNTAIAPSDSLFDAGTQVTLTALPDAGTSFFRWNGTMPAWQNPLTVTMNSNITQVALMNDTSGWNSFPYESMPRGFASVGGYTYPSGTTGGSSVDNNEVFVSTTAELQNIMTKRVDPEGTIGFPPVKVYVTGILSRDAGVGEMVDVKDVYDVSIIGVGTDATITGYGLNVTRSKNIIIRNIKFASWSDDAISVDGDDDPAKGNHIWIDHCTFTYNPPPGYPAGTTPDGSIDITHAADYVTVSHCVFDSTDKNSLVGHSNTNTVDSVMKITYYNNWFKSSVQRNPRVRFAKVHVFNNYYTNNSIYGVSSNMEGDVLVEANYFFNTPIPTETSRDGSPPGDLVERYNVFVNCGAPGSRGSAFVASNFYPYMLDSASILPVKVPSYSGSGKYDFSNPITLVPVELISFNAMPSSSGILLEWITASETNNFGFEVEKMYGNNSAAHPEEWKTIGFVKGSGTSTSNNKYSSADATPLNGRNRYRLKQINYDGTFTHSPIIESEFSGNYIFGLYQNYPNPFNPVTQIKYTVPVSGFVSLELYDVLGNLVRTLVADTKSAGEYSVSFDGSTLATGIYIYKLRAGGNFVSRKMLLLK